MKCWYRSSQSVISILLLPISWIFYGLVALRSFLYRKQIKKTQRFSVPIIIVGNITAGGTGKTPLVIWLANFLKTKGFYPGIVSRGVGGKKQRAPCCVEAHADPAVVGDEAVLLARRAHCPVVICVDRVAAVNALLEKNQCNIVIADDGLQHYRLGRDVEIVVIDGARGFGNHNMLPAGPLREPPSRLERVNFIVRQGKPLAGETGMQLQGDRVLALQAPHHAIPLENWRGKTVHAVAAIGNPERFFLALRAAGLNIIPHSFPDHYQYQAEDFAFVGAVPIIMTEKDAVKCEPFADERFWFIPVDAVIEEKFGEAVLRLIG